MKKDGRIQIRGGLASNIPALDKIAEREPIVTIDTKKLYIKLNDELVLIANYSAEAKKLEIDFTYQDWTNGKKLIGLMSKYLRVLKIAVIIDSGNEFNEGTITIGDDNAHGRLMTAAVCDLTKANIYHNEQDSEYAEDTNVYVYFETGAPTQGTGTIIIYLL